MDHEELVASFVERLQQLGLRQPAVLLLEAHRPLGLLGSQILTFLQPIFGPSSVNMGRLAEALQEPGFIDRLIERLEDRGT